MLRIVVTDYLEDPDVRVQAAARAAHRAVAALIELVGASEEIPEQAQEFFEAVEQAHQEGVPVPAPLRPHGSSNHKGLKRWCDANGIEWGGRGRPPVRVLEAYQAAQLALSFAIIAEGEPDG
jgi:DhnA family fructose-bisphosphate aldolase class Ia